MADVVIAFATIEVGEATIVEVVAEGGPTVKATEVELAIAVPFTVPVMFAVPALVDDVSVAL
jgi:hypothetical protein